MLKFDINAALRVCVPGEIVTFDGAKRTASVKILLKRILPDGSLVDYAPITVRVVTPQGGGGYLQFPIAKGDQGLVVFADRDIGSWFQTGDNTQQPSQRMHNLSDGFFIPGINSMNNTKIPAYPTDKVVLGYMGNQLEISSTGWNVVGDGGAEIDLNGEIITVKNTTTTLMTLMIALIAAIEGIQVTGNLALTPASVTALQLVQTEMETLLA